MADIDIFDSNIWKHGLTNSVDGAADLVADVRRGDRNVVLDAYIFQEVVNAFQRDLTGDHQNRALTGFSEFVWKCESVELLNPEAVEDLETWDVRNAPEHELISDLIGCQAKDAPILVLAVECRERHWTNGWELQRPVVVDVHTADEPFADAIESSERLRLISQRYADPR